MKSFFLIAGTIVYTLLGVMTFQTVSNHSCEHWSEWQRISVPVTFGISWPVGLLVVGGSVVFADTKNVWECRVP